MFLSVFDMFKIGVGPSSSHTMGPMVAGVRFLEVVRALPFAAHGLRARLHGSLAFTGKGHATDRAVILGLAGMMPETYDAERAEVILRENIETQTLTPPDLGPLVFNPERDLIFDYGPALAGHANGMVLMALDKQGDIIAQETYFSIGGGFVLTEAEQGARTPPSGPKIPYPFESAAQMLEMAAKSGKSIAQMKRENERVTRSDAEIDAKVALRVHGLTVRTPDQARALITIDGKPVRAFEANDPLDTDKKGWFVDLTVLPPAERMVGDPFLLGNVLVAASIIPSSDPCDAGGTGYINALDAYTGTSVQNPFFDVDGDGAFDDDRLTSGSDSLPVGSVNLGIAMPTSPTVVESLLVAGGSLGTTGSVAVNNPLVKGRISWRELIKD